ncbi:hypothetical protein E8Q24_26265 [Salmonella enterica]|nr:hypothetical protein [Salmonella enterica subsp. enterica serovar Dahomey]
MTEPLHLVLPGRGAPVRMKKIRNYLFPDPGEKKENVCTVRTVCINCTVRTVCINCTVRIECTVLYLSYCTVLIALSIPGRTTAGATRDSENPARR